MIFSGFLILKTVSFYQNYHCAICHGVDNWVTWNLRTNCYDRLIETGFKNTAATLLSEDCEIINEVPESIADDSRIARLHILREEK